MKTSETSDSDVIDLAVNVLTSIAGDLHAGIYTDLKGSLSLGWSDEPIVSAWAEAPGDPNVPPNHRVVICYELAVRLYRDVEDYHEFAEGPLFKEPYEKIFEHFEPKPKLPEHIDRFDSIRNMFIGALTWVFFHEIGHLMQEHGYIRYGFGGQALESCIEDCESVGSRELSSRESLVSHVTEFAADVEAAQWCMLELIRHFLPRQRDITEHDLNEFHGNLFLMMAGVSCALYRFNGDRAVEPTENPISSHPTPIRRLEVFLPNVFEKLDFGGRGHELHGLSRRELVYLCTGAAYSAGFSWLWRYGIRGEIPDHFMAKGLLQDPFKVSYWGAIVRTWDEVEPEIRRIRRFGNPLGILSFTSQFRNEIFGGNVSN